MKNRSNLTPHRAGVYERGVHAAGTKHPASLAALTELEWTKGVLREVMPVAMSSKFWPYFGPEDLPHWDTATTLNLFCRCCASKGVSNSPRSIPSNGSASCHQEGVTLTSVTSIHARFHNSVPVYCCTPFGLLGPLVTSEGVRVSWRYGYLKVLRSEWFLMSRQQQHHHQRRRRQNSEKFNVLYFYVRLSGRNPHWHRCMKWGCHGATTYVPLLPWRETDAAEYVRLLTLELL